MDYHGINFFKLLNILKLGASYPIVKSYWEKMTSCIFIAFYEGRGGVTPHSEIIVGYELFVYLNGWSKYEVWVCHIFYGVTRICTKHFKGALFILKFYWEQRFTKIDLGSMHLFSLFKLRMKRETDPFLLRKSHEMKFLFSHTNSLPQAIE